MINEEIFKRKRFSAARAAEYGFKAAGDGFVYETDFMGGDFLAVITVDGAGAVSGKVVDKMNDEEYRKIYSETGGAYVSTVRSAYEAILKEIAEDCFDTLFFASDQANRIASLIKKTYDVTPDFPFKDEKYGPSGVFRHIDSKKWFGLIMNVNEKVLTDAVGRAVDVMNLKIDPADGERLRKIDGIFPAYHMNHKSWISVILDGRQDDALVMDLIGESFRLTKKK